jgi:hypothetical protein
MAKIDLDSIKESFPHVEKFARKYTTETLMVTAILVGALSAWAHFFMGGIGLTVIFMVAGAVSGIFFPTTVDYSIKRVFALSAGNKTGEMVAEGIKIAVALFLPFIYFGFLGLLVGTAYHHYTHFGHKSK